MIKVTIGESKTQSEKPFPKLMKHKTGAIVLFCEYGRGTIIKNGTFGNIGQYLCYDDKFEGFTDYNEPITLQNA